MSMQARIWELQQVRATIHNDHLKVYCDRRILEIQTEIVKLKTSKSHVVKFI